LHRQYPSARFQPSPAKLAEYSLLAAGPGSNLGRLSRRFCSLPVPGPATWPLTCAITPSVRPGAPTRSAICPWPGAAAPAASPVSRLRRYGPEGPRWA